MAGKSKRTDSADQKKTAKKRKPRYNLKPEHVEFICQEIGELRGYGRLSDSCVNRFPAYPPRKTNVARKKWWAMQLCRHFPRDKYGVPEENCEHMEEIQMYRRAWRDIKGRKILAHAAGRFEKLEEICNLALEARIVRYQSVKTTAKDKKTGKLITLYEKIPIYEKALGSAIRAIEDMRIESGDDAKAFIPGVDVGKREPIRFEITETKPEHYEIHDTDPAT